MLFIEDNPPLVSERNQDGLLLLAFNAAMEGKESLAKQYVHQALLLQYVKQVGRGGVKTFFAGYQPNSHLANHVESQTEIIKLTQSSTTTSTTHSPESVHAPKKSSKNEAIPQAA